MYALNLSDDGRILSATYPEYAPAIAITVDSLPDGDISEYRYVDGEYIHDPLPVPVSVPTPTQQDRFEAQLLYTALMTDTLLSEDEPTSEQYKGD